MAATADLLMPKLGLTMEEGRVAGWQVAPGGAFKAGDTIVVIETDKISNEVEAPADGTLIEILAPEGAVLPVSAPIARWRLEGAPSGAHSRDNGATATPVHEAAPGGTSAPGGASAPAMVEARPSLPGANGRILATPYARRLAREAGIDLGDITGTGPRNRIKADDVVRARSAAAALPAVQPTPLRTRDAAPSPPSPARGLSLAEVDVDLGAISEIGLALTRAVPGAGPVELALLAGLRALPHLAPEADAMGVEIETGDGAPRVGAMHPSAHPTVSAVAAALAQLRGGRLAAVPGGRILVVPASAPVHRFAPAPPPAWDAALGIASERLVMRVGAAGRLDAHPELTLSLVYDPAAIANGRALAFLAAVKSLLEEPLHLLAG